MAMKSDPGGLARVSSKEHGTHRQGREGAGTLKLGGPVRSVTKNATSGGGINRPTRGTGAGKKDY